MNLLPVIDPDTTPEFVTEIILTYVAEHFDSIKNMVSCIVISQAANMKLYRTWKIWWGKNWQIWQIIPITDIIKKFTKNVLGICTDYSPKFSSPIAFTCMVCQNFSCQVFPVYVNHVLGTYQSTMC